MTEKNRKRLRQFDDEGHAARILHMPAELLAEARRGKVSPKRCAMLVETALAIELLLMTALRIKNLAGSSTKTLNCHGQREMASVTSS